MAAQCTANGINITKTGLSIADASAKSYCFWMKRNGSTATFSTAACLSGGTVINTAPFTKFESTSTGTTLKETYNTFSSPTFANPVTLSAWLFVCYSDSGTSFSQQGWFAYLGNALSSYGAVNTSYTGTLSRLIIGADADTSGGYLGSFAYFRVWAGVRLSQAQFAQEMASTTPVNTGSLVLSWPLATWGDTTDQSGNGNTPTFNGAGSTDTSPAINTGPPPSQFFMGSAPLAALAWIAERRERVPREEATGGLKHDGYL